MKRLLLLAALLGGCSPMMVKVRVEAPPAHVVVPRGCGTPEVDLMTPFIAYVEPATMAPSGGIPLIFKLDAEQARNFGVDHAIDIYARLNVAKPRDVTVQPVLRLVVPLGQLHQLVHGEVGEIAANVEDTENMFEPRKMATLTMRLSRF